MNREENKDRINILMVDDSPTNLLALESILRAPDRNLIRAHCGEDALRYLLDNDAAVVLLDVYMPGIDGLETAKLIRGREKSRAIPIIFLTANTNGADHLSRGYSLGAVDYIVKPVDPQILRSKVAVFVELFKKRRQIKRQAQLLREKNLALENANLARLNMLIDLGHELAAEREPEKVLATFCRSIRRIVGSEEAAVSVLDGEHNSGPYFFRCHQRRGMISKSELPPVVHKAIERVLVEKKALRLSEADELLFDSDVASAPIRSFLGAPIVSASGLTGWLCFVNRNNADDFSEADERLAVTLSTQISVAYENARLYAEANAANRAKDEFLATLSHELRTPLTAILGWSHIMRENKLDEAQLSRGLETIERNARSQSQLIDDLLDVSRIITGKLEIEPRVVDLVAVIESAIDSLRPALLAKRINLAKAFANPACLVNGDPHRLQQILWNLFSNAVKFTPSEGTITVSARNHSAWVHVSVADTGVGIPREFLPYIFDRFRQADGSTTRAHGGLGLGLAIARHLVELHRGTIEVESGGKNQGSVFTVNIPSIVDPTSTDNRLRRMDDSEFSDESLLNGIRILVVDDEPDSRDLVRTILTSYGSEVRCSESVAEAMQTFHEWNPDLLVSDIGMPVEDGYCLIKKLRKLKSKRAKEIPAIALTAYAAEEDRSLALSSGFQTHVAKPVEAQGLLKSIVAALGRGPTE